MKFRFYSIVFAVILLASCANRGIGPQGGPKDSIPPLPLHSDPEIGALNFKGKRIEVTFNEYLQLDNVANNLLMSPPQQTPPDVKARGKKLVIQFQDTLRDSTTYTLDFGDAVCDYHEKTPLHHFSFYFSTGDEIDTLEATGMVYDAMTLNPVYGVLVGIHSEMDDSAFVTQPFLRIAKTDSTGFYRIGNIHPGTYRIYGVEDMSRDYRLTVGESLAFQDEPIEISAIMTEELQAVADSLDTLNIGGFDRQLLDSLITDTLMPDSVKAFMPHPVHGPHTVLFLFKEEQQKLYLQKSLRDEQHKVSLIFSAPPDSLMSFRALRPSEVDTAKSDSAWIDPTPYMYLHASSKLDTVTLWLTDSAAVEQDSLYLEARYRRTDSVYHLEWYVDTIRAIWRAPKMTAKMKEAQERKNRNRRLDLKTNARKGFEIYDTLRLNCSSPLAAIERDSIHLFERVDTLMKPMAFEIEPYDTLPMRLTFLATFEPGGRYELKIDSGALHDVYGTTHIAGSYPLEVKTLSDYSTLRVKLEPFEPKARIQVMDSKDQVLRELPAAPEGAFFEYLKPDTYYLRLYIDENGDGQWTTGSWVEKRQPEAIYYFPEKIQTKSNWDFEEVWDYQAVPQVQSKPKELINAAPKKKR